MPLRSGRDKINNEYQVKTNKKTNKLIIDREVRYIFGNFVLLPSWYKINYLMMLLPQNTKESCSVLVCRILLLNYQYLNVNLVAFGSAIWKRKLLIISHDMVTLEYSVYTYWLCAFKTMHIPSNLIRKLSPSQL